jgi:ComF family protein
MGFWGRAISGLLDALAPPTCVACDALTTEVFCDSCGAVAPAPGVHSIDGVRLLVAGSYAAPLSTAILRFKYAGRPELSRRLARLLLPALRELELSPGTVLVPVPLHARRLAKRGYNQAALLAQELSDGAGLDCQPRLLLRTRETERQVGKARDERLTNAQGAFELRKPAARRVVLVDDVVTTGSTVRACAQALTKGGVELTAVVALAQAGTG